MTRHCSCWMAFLLLNAASSMAADWPAWRGPEGDSIARSEHWRPEALGASPRILWESQVGKGYSAVTVVKGRLYTAGNDAEQDTIFCLNAETGARLWQYSYPCPAQSYPGPRATPVVDDGAVYMLSRTGLLISLNAETGAPNWQVNAAQETGAKAPTWAFASSVCIQGNLALVNIGEHGAAFAKASGRLVWKSAPKTSGYATPVVVKHNGRECALIFGAKAVYGVAPDTGQLLWSYPWETKHDVNAADPILAGDQLFITSGYNKGCALIDISAMPPRLVWQNNGIQGHFSTPVLHDGFLYGIDGNAGRGSLKCLNLATGEEKWQANTGFGSLLAANGKLIVLNETGSIIVLEATPEAARELTRTPSVLSRTCWTMPVLSNGLLYCRNDKGHLVCIDAR